MQVLHEDVVNRIDSLRSISEKAAKEGAKVVFFTGTCEVFNKSTKRYFKVEGIYRNETNTYYIKADGITRSAEQVFLHELLHRRIRNNPKMLLDAAEELAKTYTKEELDRLIDQYCEAYHGIYGIITEDMSADEAQDVYMKYIEEICADAYAGIRRGSINTVKAERVMETYRTDTQKQTKAATERTNGPGENKTEEGGGVKYSFAGYAEDGRGKYNRNYPIGTTKKTKGADILSYIQNVWSKKPISLLVYENGKYRTIEAQFDPTYDESKNEFNDATKLMGENRHGTSKEQRVTLDLASDYYKIASEAKYNYSKDEDGKDSEAHKDVKQWHYFINGIYFAEYGTKEYEPYIVTINVKEKIDGSFVYSFNAEKERRIAAPGTLHAPVNNGITAEANNNPSVQNHSKEALKSQADNNADSTYIVGIQLM